MATARRFLYGRRQGPKLSAARQALVDRRLPALGLMFPDEQAGPSLDPRMLFDPPVEEVWLEIGFGAGEHLAQQAAAHPIVGFIGCEPFKNGVASLISKIEAEGLRNIRLYTDDARLLLAHLKDASIGRLFVLFPDPWPKLRHHKRRIIGPATVGVFARVLADGAELRAATDHAAYGEYMLEHLSGDPAFERLAGGADDHRQRPADWPATRYEAKALEAGRRPHYLRFRRQPRSGEGDRRVQPESPC
jgi:tRNA (guanine-N7-)-methyltransferase